MCGESQSLKFYIKKSSAFTLWIPWPLDIPQTLLLLQGKSQVQAGLYAWQLLLKVEAGNCEEAKRKKKKLLALPLQGRDLEKELFDKSIFYVHKININYI